MAEVPYYLTEYLTDHPTIMTDTLDRVKFCLRSQDKLEPVPAESVSSLWSPSLGRAMVSGCAYQDSNMPRGCAVCSFAHVGFVLWGIKGLKAASGGDLYWEDRLGPPHACTPAGGGLGCEVGP